MEQPIPHNDKRQQKRYAGVYAEYALIQSAEDQENATYQHCFIRDFSAGGAGIFISERIPDYSLILMRIYDPNVSAPIKTLGGIAWSHLSEESPSGRQRFNVGIKFLRVEEGDQARLQRMIDHFESLKYKKPGVMEYL